MDLDGHFSCDTELPRRETPRVPFSLIGLAWRQDIPQICSYTSPNRTS
jgi:hypothetical protein